MITKPIVTFVFPTYDRRIPLYSALLSLLNQTSDNWEAIVVQDGETNSTSMTVVTNLPPCPQKANVKHMWTKERHNDWGHTPREIGKQAATGHYIIMSGDDNYYVPTFVEEFEKATKDTPGMIYWDMVHSHYGYSHFVCSPAYNQIDMGAFATRSDLAKRIRLNTSFAADGEYVEEFKAVYPDEAIIKINKVLYVHN